MNQETVIAAVTAGSILISLLLDRGKTQQGLVKGCRLLIGLLPQFLLLTVIVGLVLAVTPESTIVELLGAEAGARAPLLAALIGSVALLPGSIAYPLAAMLRERGVSDTSVAIFITTLMMVGVATFPVEREYFGFRLSLLRNLLCLAAAVASGLMVGALL